MSWPKLLVLVRHAESEGNVRTVEERAAYDVPTHEYDLTARGRRQAALTGLWLRGEYGGFDIRYTSYYTRAKETMQIMCPGEKVYEDPRLREAERGIWATHTQEQIARLYPGEIERKTREGLYHYRPIGGQNWPDIEERIHSFLGTLARDCGGKKVLIVVHGHWLILFQRLIERFPIDEAVRRYHKAPAPNASETAYRGAPRWSRRRLVRIAEHVTPWAGKL